MNPNTPTGPPSPNGLTSNGWNQLITLLTKPARRPHRGHPPALTLAEQTLATVLRQRFATPQPVLAELFGVVTATIAKAQRHTTPLLRQHHCLIRPGPRPLTTLADLTSYAAHYNINLTPKPKAAR